MRLTTSFVSYIPRLTDSSCVASARDVVAEPAGRRAVTGLAAHALAGEVAAARRGRHVERVAGEALLRLLRRRRCRGSSPSAATRRCRGPRSRAHGDPARPTCCTRSAGCARRRPGGSRRGTRPRCTIRGRRSCLPSVPVCAAALPARLAARGRRRRAQRCRQRRARRRSAASEHERTGASTIASRPFISDLRSKSALIYSVAPCSGRAPTSPIFDELRGIQRTHGYLPEGGAARARRAPRAAALPAAGGRELLSAFFLKPPARAEVRVCGDMACHRHGANDAARALVARYQGQDVNIRHVSCLGRCDLGAGDRGQRSDLRAGRATPTPSALIDFALAGASPEQLPARRAHPLPRRASRPIRIRIRRRSTACCDRSRSRRTGPG